MSITDGSVVCSLCGEGRTGCHLCGKAPLVDISTELRREAQATREADDELWRQSQAIRRAADRRAGWLE